MDEEFCGHCGGLMINGECPADPFRSVDNDDNEE